MKATRVSAGELQQSFGALRERAMREPVVITENGDDALVIMAIAEWKRLQRRDRRVGLAEDLPDEWLEAVRKARVPADFAHLDDELK